MTRRPFLLALCVVAAALLQTTLFARLGLAGVAPNLVSLVVIAAAAELTDTGAAFLGFAAGLFLDGLSETPLGLWAASLTVVGYLVRLGETVVGGSFSGLVASVAIGSFGAEGLFAGIGSIFGQATLSGGRTVRTMLLVTVYNLVLAVVVVPIVRRVARGSGRRVGW